ncbi:helix-turn-helix transcriptional regulator [Streptomyces sp. MI02-7b]|uniref:helix-turn-helix domain-containing protein n=1 Tax=Streptomyces sp. MI02-7b TaxID=462941 RepID=UPI0029ACCEC7|nr:helix-turn-helix transcriptional regulator [Streptomyces sp. MI02-7b]MDX3074716.1 helix-turn-helix transcriptional regulator [Streptomyces sp. MI02-7b]
MTGETAQPPMAWRYCGNQVKLWREQAGVTRERLADEAGYGVETVRSMELGRRRPMLRLLQVADHLCGAGGKLLAAQEFLKPEKFPARSQEFIRYEAEAVSLWSYEPLLVPGLLQTEATARALLCSHRPPMDDETIGERVRARLERQELLRRKPPVECSFVLYEAALRCPVGGPDTAREQLLHLLEVAALRNVSVQVLPFAAGAHPGLNGPIVLLETGDHDRLALTEGQSLSLLTADPQQVGALTQRHGMIRMEALGTEESARFIKRMAGEP